MIATTLASLWRADTTEDDRGDAVDAPLQEADAVFQGQPCSIVEKSRRVYNPETQRWQSVTLWVGRLYPRHQALKGDRLRDDRTGVIYLVDEAKTVRGIGGQSELVLDLRTV